MNNTLSLKKATGETVKVTLQHLDSSYLSKIIALQQEIYSHMKDKTWYACTSESEFEAYFSKDSVFLGCLTPEDQLIALGVYVKAGLDKQNYGYDLDFLEEHLLSSGNIESTIVHADFRGNKLQQLLCTEIENIAKTQHTTTLLATVCPDNIYSLNTFLKLGYTVKKEKLKYGTLRRYIVQKNI